MELEAPMIIDDLLFGSTFLAGIHVKNQRIPTPFVRELELWAHREDAAGADEKR